MRATSEATILNRGGPTPAARDDVIDLEAQGRAADASGIERPLALALVPNPHLPLHLCRHGSLSLLLMGDEQLQRRGEHLLVGRSWLNV